MDTEWAEVRTNASDADPTRTAQVQRDTPIVTQVVQRKVTEEPTVEVDAATMAANSIARLTGANKSMRVHRVSGKYYSAAAVDMTAALADNRRSEWH